MGDRIPYRQIHLDFHTSPEIPDVGADFDAENFADILKSAHVNSINLFAKCHHGMYYYPTSIGTQHPALKGFDLFGAQIEACRKAGIRTCAYTCVAWNEDWANRHPEWLCFTYDGLRGNKLPFEDGYVKWNTLCINQPKYRDVIKAELKEIQERYHPDGYWIDIVNSYECVCPVCRDEMLEMGLDPKKREDVQKHDRMAEIAYCRDIYTFLKAMDPNLDIYFNSFPYALDNGVNKETSSATKRKYYSFVDIESLPSEEWGYNHFPISASYVNKYDQEIAMMNGKFHFSWADFGTLRNQAAMEYECFRALAYGAKICMGDQLHPSGRLDPTVYRQIGQVFASVEAKEPWLHHTRPVCEVGVFVTSGETATPQTPALVEEGVYRMLIELHIPFHFLNCEDDFSGYRLLILPDCFVPDKKLAEKIDDYAARGGKLLVTGRSGVKEGKFLLQTIKAEFKGKSEFTTRYIRLDPKYFQDIPQMDHVLYEQGYSISSQEVAAARIVEPYFNRSYLHFCSHRQTPPKKEAGDEPAVIFGSNYVYISSPLFTDYINNGYKVHREIIRACIDRLLPDRLVLTDLPTVTEMTVRENEEAYIIHLLNYVMQKKSKRLELIEETYPVYDRHLFIKLEKPPRMVLLEPEGTELPAVYQDGYLRVELPAVSGHTMIEVLR